MTGTAQTHAYRGGPACNLSRDRDYAVEQMRKDLEAQADCSKSVDPRILALILIVTALFSFNIAVLGFDKVPNLSALASLDLARAGDTTPNGILALGTLILTSASLVSLANAYWLFGLKRPPRLCADRTASREVAQEQWLAAARPTFERNEAMIALRRANVLRALGLLGGQCVLVAHLAIMDIVERGTPSVFGIPDWLVKALGTIAVFGSLVWLIWRSKPPVDD